MPPTYVARHAVPTRRAALHARPAASGHAAIAIAFFACALVATALRPADAADAAPVPAPAPSASAVPAGPQPDPAAEGFGDFGGARSRLERDGVAFRGHYVAESSGNPIGGLQQGTAYASELMLGTDIDLAKKIPGSGLGTFHVTLTEREGSSLSQLAVGNVLTLQEIYGNGLQPHVTEASYDQKLLRGAIDVDLGRVITENDFADAPQYWGANLYCEYQSNAICGTPLAAPIDSRYVPDPSSAWGARVRGTVSPSLSLASGFYEVNTLTGTSGHGLSLGLGGDTGVYFPAEIDVTLAHDGATPSGSLRVGGYFDTSVAKAPGAQLARFDPDEAARLNTLPVPSARGREGAWFQVDRLVEGHAGPGARGTAAFLAAEYGDPQTSLISAFLDAGLVRHGTFRGRDGDTLGVGYAYAGFNPRLRAVEESLAAQGFATVPVTNHEQILEANYGIQVLPYASLRPGAQYVIRPSGTATIRNAFVLDLSTTIAF